MKQESALNSKLRILFLALLCWLSMVGSDFFLNAGILSRLYLRESPFLLPPMEAFKRLPLGYPSMFLSVGLLLWLMVRITLAGWRAGGL